ncbi:MAG: zincin-like metallopeptidase domain-containing protein [Bacteroidota bacterium]
MLENHSGKSPYFITLSKVREQEGVITDEDKITSIVSYVPRFKKDNKPDKGERRKPDWMQPKFHSVINVDFVTGIKKPQYKATAFKKLELNQYVENFIKELKRLKRIPELIYDQTDSCYYVSNPPLFTTDEIHLVQINSFKGIAEYYSTLFHEITHSTKSANRMGCRDKKSKKKLAYANEELVAEMGAMIACTELGLEYNRQNSLTYLKGWLSKAKKGDKNIDDVLIEAYSFACDAAEYLLKDIDLEKLIPDTMQDRANEETEELEKDSKILFEDDRMKLINHFVDERVKLFFKTMPDKGILKILKDHKFRYAPTAKAWQKVNTEKNIEELKSIVNNYVKNRDKKIPGANNEKRLRVAKVKASAKLKLLKLNK